MLCCRLPRLHKVGLADRHAQPVPRLACRGTAGKEPRRDTHTVNRKSTIARHNHMQSPGRARRWEQDNQPLSYHVGPPAAAPGSLCGWAGSSTAGQVREQQGSRVIQQPCVRPLAQLPGTFTLSSLEATQQPAPHCIPADAGKAVESAAAFPPRLFALTCVLTSPMVTPV